MRPRFRLYDHYQAFKVNDYFRVSSRLQKKMKKKRKKKIKYEKTRQEHVQKLKYFHDIFVLIDLYTQLERFDEGIRITIFR